MNTATRVMSHQAIASRPLSASLSLSTHAKWAVAMFIAILLSAMTLLLVQDDYRKTLIDVESQLSLQQALEHAHNENLLEQGAFTNQKRIEQMASSQLNMDYPHQPSYIHEP